MEDYCSPLTSFLYAACHNQWAAYRTLIIVWLCVVELFISCCIRCDTDQDKLEDELRRDIEESPLRRRRVVPTPPSPVQLAPSEPPASRGSRNFGEASSSQAHPSPTPKESDDVPPSRNEYPPKLPPKVYRQEGKSEEDFLPAYYDQYSSPPAYEGPKLGMFSALWKKLFRTRPCSRSTPGAS